MLRSCLRSTICAICTTDLRLLDYTMLVMEFLLSPFSADSLDLCILFSTLLGNTVSV
jgi:hypothetical protein